MDGGVAALLGAAVGAVGTGIGACLAFVASIKQARIQARAEHAQWRRQVRRDTYLTFHALVEDAYNRNWDILEEMSLQGALTPPHVPVSLHEARQIAGAEFEPIRRARGAVYVEGPEEMRALAAALDQAVHIALDEVAQLKASSTPEMEAIHRVDAEWRDVFRGADEFLAAAAQVLDDPEPTSPR